MSKRFGKILEEACKQEGVTGSELARALGWQQSRAPQVLKSKNLTERTFKTCLWALDLDLEIRLVKRDGQVVVEDEPQRKNASARKAKKSKT